MKNIFVDNNGRVVQIAPISTGVDFDTIGVIDEIESGQYIRIKAHEDSYIRNYGQTVDGVFMSEGETEYFYLQPGKQLELVSGSINVMY